MLLKNSCVSAALLIAVFFVLGCTPKPAAAPVQNMATAVTGVPLVAKAGTEDHAGRFSFETVCAACHGSGGKLIGPSVEEIIQKYAGKPGGIVAYAQNPTKVRGDYPPMPPQSHLSREKLDAIADYLLKQAK